MSPDQPLDLTKCPVCGRVLDGMRCSGPKGCGRSFELRTFMSLVEIPSPQSALGISPHDLAARPATRTAMGADGTVRRVRVRR